MVTMKAKIISEESISGYDKKDLTKSSSSSKSVPQRFVGIFKHHASSRELGRTMAVFFFPTFNNP